MNLTFTTLRFALFSGVLTLMLVVSGAPFASAHNGEEHEDKAEAEAHEKETARILSMPEMEQMLSLLQQLVALITEHRKLVGANGYRAPVVPMVMHGADDNHGMSGMHDVGDAAGDDAHSDETGAIAAETKKLIIEVETHFGSTHVHVRYIDKPEVMFMVPASINDELALIEDIEDETDLTAAEIKAALIYLGGN